MGVLDKFLEVMKLDGDDDYDEDDFFDEDDFEDEYEEEKPKRGIFKKEKANTSYEEEEEFEPRRSSRPTNNKVTPMRQPSRKSAPAMEVCVIKPNNMEDTREIADTLIDRCTVVLNLEGIDVDVAQRIIDFSSGACYSIAGSLQKISSYIFILTPANVEISGDFQEILSGAFDVPSVRTNF